MKPIRITPLAVALAAGLVASLAPAMGGGFGTIIERATPQNSGKVKDAAVIVRAMGCIEPGTSTLTVTLEGLVKGERKTVAIAPTKISPDLFAISQKDLRPAVNPGDAWVLAINAEGKGMHSRALVVLDAAGKVRTMRPAEKGRSEQLESLASREPFTAKQIMMELSKQANNPRTASAVK